MSTSNTNANLLGMAGCLTVVLLTGCTASSIPDETSSSPASSTSAATTAPALAPTPLNSEPKMVVEKMDKTCSQILPNEGLRAIQPNISLDTVRQDAISTVGKNQVTLGGIACTTNNSTTKVQVNVAVVKLSSSSAKTKEAELAQSGQATYIPSPDHVGYFSQDGATGTGQFVLGQYWVSVSSEDFKDARNPSAYSFLVSRNL